MNLIAHGPWILRPCSLPNFLGRNALWRWLPGSGFGPAPAVLEGAGLVEEALWVWAVQEAASGPSNATQITPDPQSGADPATPGRTSDPLQSTGGWWLVVGGWWLVEDRADTALKTKTPHINVVGWLGGWLAGWFVGLLGLGWFGLIRVGLCCLECACVCETLGVTGIPLNLFLD